MKQLIFLFIFTSSISSFSKEWNNLKQFQKETKLEKLTAKDWLCVDRKKNTLIWQQANIYNLKNNLPEEYLTIKQRRDFYKWYYSVIEKQGHEVVWPKMAYFISSKLRLVKAFPYTFFTKKSIKRYSYQGSETVFNNAFSEMKQLYFSKLILKGNEALQWDESILYKEQHKWIESIYISMDANSLKTIERMAKGNGFYSIMLAKEIRFQGDISRANDRYDYAIHALRDFCEKIHL